MLSDKNEIIKLIAKKSSTYDIYYFNEILFYCSRYIIYNNGTTTTTNHGHVKNDK
jgi:hypothetical protein